MKVIEFFAGSRSISKEVKKLGMKVFSTDIEAYEGIDYQVDILDFDPSKVPFKPDIIWASIPCTAFSVAAIGHNWKSTKKGLKPKTESAKSGIEIAKKTLYLIDYFSPKYFWIENPRGALRKMDFMQHLPIHTVTYCQYGDTRMKPTDIWTNNTLWGPRPSCNNGDPCHESAPRGSRTGTQGISSAYERSIVPASLCREVLISCMTNGELQKVISSRVISLNKKLMKL